MSYTKRQFVVEAFEAIGVAEYVYDLSPEQLQGALRKLDAMMATWNGKGIRVGYPLPASPQDSSLDEVTGVPDSANETIYCNLAIRLAPGLGKNVSPDVRAMAASGYNGLLSRAAMPRPVKTYGMPAGAGNKNLEQPFIDPTPDGLETGPDGLPLLE